MRGRGLLIAAAVLQLVCAATLLLFALTALLVLPSLAGMHEPQAMTPWRVMAAIYLALAALTIWVSIKLLQHRRWAWIVSLAMAVLVLLLFVVGVVASAMRPSMGFGFGELIILSGFVTPVVVDVALLIAGQRATRGAAAPRA